MLESCYASTQICEDVVIDEDFLIVNAAKQNLPLLSWRYTLIAKLGDTDGISGIKSNLPPDPSETVFAIDHSGSMEYKIIKFPLYDRLWSCSSISFR